jgi:Tfp pilus assembly pilus retraction ATPase PilT
MIGGVPQVPHTTVNRELLPFRQALPIWSMRDDIVSLINSNQVVLVCGDTGSGKTTQVNPLNAELNPVCHLLALLEAHHILHVSRIRVKCCLKTGF